MNESGFDGKKQLFQNDLKVRKFQNEIGLKECGSEREANINMPFKFGGGAEKRSDLQKKKFVILTKVSPSPGVLHNKQP